MSERKYTRLGAEIRAARKERGWSLRTMGRLLGCNHQRIILWEKGANRPNRAYRDLLTVLFATRFDFSPDEQPMTDAESGADMRTERRFHERAA